MTRKRRILIGVCPEFRNILKVESALRGTSVYELTKEIAGQDVFISDYIESLNEKRRLLKKKNGGNGFVFDF